MMKNKGYYGLLAFILATGFISVALQEEKSQTIETIEVTSRDAFARALSRDWWWTGLPGHGRGRRLLGQSSSRDRVGRK